MASTPRPVKSSTRQRHAFFIRTDKRTSLLFEVEQRPSLDLVIIVKHAPFGMLPDAEGHLTAELISEQHFTIDRSLNSPTNINQISMRTKLASGETRPFHTGHFTRALKQHANYAPVFTQRCADLRYEHYAYTPKVSDVAVDLGSIDCARFQLIYQILVSNHRAERLYPAYRTNSLHLDFAAFRLTVLWSFLSVPSTEHGMSLLLGTTKPEELHLLEDENMRHLSARMPDGIIPAACVVSFVNLRGLFVENFVRQELALYSRGPAPATSDQLMLHKRFIQLIAAFFRQGTTNVKYRQHARRCENQMLRDRLFVDDPVFRYAVGL